MHSLPSRRRLPQPNFFRFKCYRLSPVPLPRLSPSPPPPPPPPAPPAAAAASAVIVVLSGLLPAAAAHLPFIAPPPVPAGAHALAHTPPAGAARRQARLRPPAQTQPQYTPGTERQAHLNTHLWDAPVRRQGRGTVSQSSNRDSVIAPDQSHALIFMTSAHLHHTHLCSCVWWCRSLTVGRSGLRKDTREGSVWTFRRTEVIVMFMSANHI